MSFYRFTFGLDGRGNLGDLVDYKHGLTEPVRGRVDDCGLTNSEMALFRAQPSKVFVRESTFIRYESIARLDGDNEPVMDLFYEGPSPEVIREQPKTAVDED